MDIIESFILIKNDKEIVNIYSNISEDKDVSYYITISSINNIYSFIINSHDLNSNRVIHSGNCDDITIHYKSKTDILYAYIKNNKDNVLKFNIIEIEN